MKILLTFLLCFLSFFSQASNTSEVVLVSHKGLWKDMSLPQNTKESLVAAIEKDFLGIEFDVFMTLDEVFVLAHDDSLNKVTNCKGKISKSLYRDIKNCIVVKNTLLPITKILLKKVKNPKSLTTLSELLTILNEYSHLKLVWIDLKPETQKMMAPLFKTIETYADSHLKDVLVVNNGDSKLVKEMKKSYPAVRYSLEGKWGSEPLVDESFINNAGITHDIISLNVGFRLGDESPLLIINKKKRFYKRLALLLEKARAKNIPVIGWTVNKEDKLEKLMTYDLDFLLTDRVSNNY